MDTDVFYGLVEKSKHVVWQRDDRKEMFVLFSVSGYTKRLVELAEMRGDLVLKS